MEYGYIRVFGSSEESDGELGAQFAALSKYGLDTRRIVVEQRVERPPFPTPNLEELLTSLGAEDVLVVSSFASIGYGVNDLLRLVLLCADEGVGLVSIDDALDTRTCGDTLLSVLKSVQAMERAKTRRINARRPSSAQGEAKRGRPKLDDAAVENAARMYMSRMYTMKEVVEKTDISKATIFKKVRELRAMAEEAKLSGIHYDPSVMQSDDAGQQ